VHQIVGGNAFNASMHLDIPTTATCTTCTFAEDFSNYWTAVLYFRARNGSLKRVSQTPNVGFEQAKGGMTIYYTPTLKGNTNGSVTAFKPVSCSAILPLRETFFPFFPFSLTILPSQ
jgi:hypothetical protein